MARPKGSKNNSNTQKQPAKTQQEVMKDMVHVTGEQLTESYNDSKIIENINETVETINLSPEAADNILEGLESPPSPNEALLNAVTNSEEFQKSAEDWENRVVGAQEEFVAVVEINTTLSDQELADVVTETINKQFNPLESSTSDSEPSEPLSHSEEDKIAQNESESVIEGVAEDGSASPSGKFNVSGGTLAETVEKVLAYSYQGAEFGSSWPLIKKWPYQVQLQVTQELTLKAPVFNPEEEYYTIVVRHYSPVDFIRSIIELAKVGVVINRKDIGLVGKGVFQFKLFSPVPLNSSIYGLTVKPRTPIIYTKERLESFNDKQLEMIKLSLELSETKREDIIEAILEAQDK